MLPESFPFTISIPIYLIFLMVWIKKRKKFSFIFLCTLFYFYIIAVISVTLFPLPIDKNFIESMKSISQLEINNFIPFTFLHESINQLIPTPNDPFPYNFRVQTVLKQVGGNILLGMPFGFLVPIIRKEWNSFGKIFAAGLLFSIAIETSQFIISLLLGYTYRLTDIDDIILNCIGVALGYVSCKLFLPLLQRIKLVSIS